MRIPFRFLVFAMGCVLIGGLVYFRAGRAYESMAYDFRFRLRPLAEVAGDIVVIEISDDTLANLNRWPLPRDFHASLVDVLRELGAKKIVFDILFSEATPQDEVFSLAIKKAGNVYLSEAFYLQDRLKDDDLPAASDVILAGIITSLKAAASGEGHINVFLDPDGKIRRIPLFIRHKGSYVPHLSLRVAADVLGLDLKNTVFKSGRLVIDRRLFLPVSENSSFFVNYPGLWAKTFRHFSYFEVLKAYASFQKGLRPSLDLSVFKDKICFIGLTAAGTSDLRANPLEKVYPMVGLQASVLNSLLTKEFITDAGRLWNTVLALLVFFLSLAVCLKLSPLRVLLFNAVLASLYFFLSMLLFITGGIWIDLFFPLLVIVLTYMGALFYRFLQEARRRELLEKELEIAEAIQRSFLPSDIAEFKGIGISALMQPAKFVAGDLYDLVTREDHELGVFIGDVCGKGVPASLIMAQTVSSFRIFSRRDNSPAAVLTQLNRELSGILKGRFVTALYLIVDIDQRVIRGACAGHAPIILYDSRKDGVFEFLPSSGPPLGIEGSFVYEAFERPVLTGDKLLVYTDGITEARNARGEEFGVERVKDIIFCNKSLRGEEILGKLKREVLGFQKPLPLHDDITAVLLDI